MSEVQPTGQTNAATRALEAARVARAGRQKGDGRSAGSFERRLDDSGADAGTADRDSDDLPENPIARRLQILERSRRRTTGDGGPQHIDVLA